MLISLTTYENSLGRVGYQVVEVHSRCVRFVGIEETTEKTFVFSVVSSTRNDLVRLQREYSSGAWLVPCLHLPVS